MNRFSVHNVLIGHEATMSLLPNIDPYLVDFLAQVLADTDGVEDEGYAPSDPPSAADQASTAGGPAADIDDMRFDEPNAADGRLPEAPVQRHDRAWITSQAFANRGKFDSATDAAARATPLGHSGAARRRLLDLQETGSSTPAASPSGIEERLPHDGAEDAPPGSLGDPNGSPTGQSSQRHGDDDSTGDDSNISDLPLPDTVLFLMADHGLHYGAFSRTSQGQREHKNPPLFVVVPEWLLQEHPSVVREAC